MPPLRDLVHQAMEIGPKPPKKTAYRDSLDARNAEIINLKKQGFSNAAIGARFGIYDKTVGVVLRNHYGAQPKFSRQQSYQRALSAYIMRQRGFKFAEIGKACGGIKAYRASQLARKGARIWRVMSIRLNSNTLAPWEREFLRGYWITYDLEEPVPWLS